VYDRDEVASVAAPPPRESESLLAASLTPAGIHCTASGSVLTEMMCR
jgi:hypothetical protein